MLDYRNTEYCPQLVDVDIKKKELREEIKRKNPRTRIHYNKIKTRGSEYNKQFAKIYNKKCAYCGAKCELLPPEYFEVDHFIMESSFSDTTEGRAEAGDIKNLVWACIACNRGKRDLYIDGIYQKILNVDDNSIASVFYRDDDYSIKVSEKYRNDDFIDEFYKKLGLDSINKRLDYMLLMLDGRITHETDAVKKGKLLNIFLHILKIRNSL